jgi:electron transfer flavoprotein alpha subunit
MFLFSATELGRDLAPRLATLLDTGLTADCTELSIDPSNDLLIQTRPAFSGDLMASIICPNHRPMMATIRPHSFKLEFHHNAEIEFEFFPLNGLSITTDNNQIEIIQKNLIKSEYPLLEDQKIIISVGRGIGTQEQLKIVEAFARSIGAGLSCSRPIVDLGWLPSELQVGMSGKSVAPKLYIALGISGSVQHLVGIQSADYIIAVNRDENAPIFKVAHLGIVGNIKDVLPELKKRITRDELG